MVYETEYFKILKEAVKKNGGLFNAHLHLDRASTLHSKYLEHVGLNPINAASYSLKAKQNLTGDLHRGLAYEKEDLERRIRENLLAMIEVGTRRADTFIDVTADNVGITALEVALKIKEELKDKIEFNVYASPIFGFKDSEPERWKVYSKGAEMADGLGALPERDELAGHIGYEEHFKRVIHLAKELHKPVHIHVDQANVPNGREETLIEAVKWLGSPQIKGYQEPTVWAIHSISPSAYNQERFNLMLEGLKKYNIGVICCPTAAISMRQLRPIKAPTHNSIARILEMAEKEIPIRIGTDNISDVLLPSTTPSLYDEIHCLSNAIRFYQPSILAKFACGTQLNEVDRDTIRKHLEQDQITYQRMNMP